MFIADSGSTVKCEKPSGCFQSYTAACQRVFVDVNANLNNVTVFAPHLDFLLLLYVAKLLFELFTFHIVRRLVWDKIGTQNIPFSN